MVLGFWQLVIILYVLMIALGPRRVVGWYHAASALTARMQGRPPPSRTSAGWLRAIQLFEHSSKIGWACLVVGSALGMFAMSADGWPLWKGLAIAVAMLLLFVAPWLL